MEKSCSCCNKNQHNIQKNDGIEYICYCDKVTKSMIRDAILNQGAQSVLEVIKLTGAMKNSNCAINNPKGVCCYPDIVIMFEKYYKE